MRPRDLAALEFDRVRQRLSTFAYSPGGRDACLALEPSDDAAVVADRIEQVAQTREIEAQAEALPLGEFPDIRTALHQASHDGFVLEGSVLVGVRTVLDATRRTDAFLSKHAGKFPALAAYLPRLNWLPALRATLARALDDNGLVNDDASDELAEVRQRLRNVRAQLTRKLEDVLNRPSSEEVLSDRYITLRNNRFVLPVKTSYLPQFNGVVQDRSVSGETTFVEPPFAVELNNRLLIAAKDEERIVLRILADLTAAVASDEAALAMTYEALVALDVLHARAAFGRHYHCTRPLLDPTQVSLPSARHPVLLFGERPVTPIDLFVTPGKSALIVTGPNTGGKTVALKTLGIMALMNQCGIPIPAGEGSRMPCFRAVYADIGDSQSIEHSLSTFSSHLANIAEIIDRGVDGSLVLLDEPGVGTEPDEGAALGIGVIKYLGAAGAIVAATTHYNALKLFALSDENVVCGAVEYDAENMEPRYRLVYHTVGESLALPIARRMGLPQAVLAAAETARSDQTKQFAIAMSELEATRKLFEERAQAADEQRRATQHDRDEAARLLTELRERKRQRWSDELDRARTFVRQLRDQGRDLLAAIERGETDRRAFTKIIRTHEAVIAQKVEEIGDPAAEPGEPPKIGDQVQVVGSEIRGQLVSIQGDRAWIQRGSMRFEVPATPLRKVEAAKAGAPPRVEARVAPKEEDSGAMEVNLIGMRAREALEKLEPFLDRAMQDGLPSVRIVHGIGSGALKRAVSEYLSTSPYCSSYRPGEPGEGGAGATIAKITSD